MFRCLVKAEILSALLMLVTVLVSVQEKPVSPSRPLYPLPRYPRNVVDENTLDVHQGFLDVALLRPRDNASLILRAGRQELAFGSARLVSLREGTNVPLSFDC